MGKPAAKRLVRRAAKRLSGGPPTLAGPDPAHTAWLAKRIWEGEYDRPGFVPKRGWKVIDVGANVGVFSVLARRRHAKVVAFEPHPDTYQYLVCNARGVECHEAAVVPAGFEGQTAKLFIGGRDTRHSLLGFEQRTTARMADSVEVRAVPFDRVLAGGCDLLKMDCEGAEFDLFASLTPHHLDAVRRIVVELHGDEGQVRAFVRGLRDVGYRVERVPLEHERLAMCYAAK